MDAANPKRAAIRLAAALGGLVVTSVTATTAVYLATRPTAQQSERPAWDVIETGDSYRLPAADHAITPVAHQPSQAAPAYAPPAYAEPPVAPEPPATASAHSAPPQTPRPDAWRGPVTIHNPAAFGPPEDNSIPPAPTEHVASAAPIGPHFPMTDASSVAPVAIDTPIVARREPKPPAAPLPDYDLAEPESPEVTPAPAAVRTATRPTSEITGGHHAGMLAYTLSTNELSKRLEPEVQAAFQLGRSGAVYAARAKFVAVLRRIALAKDAEDGSTRHAKALAAGLRALDDADDFVPNGDALEAELDVPAIARSHGFRLGASGVSPHQAVAIYSQHAAQKLAAAAGGEPAGSMALYGLGKSYLRLAAQGGDTTATRKSTVMFQAAVDANPQNYLAANELGVRLAAAGRYERASHVLRTAAQQPGAIALVHANLAAVEQRLGRQQAAVAAQHQSERLAHDEHVAGEVSRRHGVQWVSPDAFRTAPRAGAAPVTPAAPAMAAAPQPQGPPAEGGWSSFVRTAKRVTGWNSPAPATVQPPAAYNRAPIGAPAQPVVR